MHLFSLCYVPTVIALAGERLVFAFAFGEIEQKVVEYRVGTLLH